MTTLKQPPCPRSRKWRTDHPAQSLGPVEIFEVLAAVANHCGCWYKVAGVVNYMYAYRKGGLTKGNHRAPLNLLERVESLEVPDGVKLEILIASERLFGDQPMSATQL